MSYGDAMITRMEHIHYLNSQHNHNATSRFSCWCGDAQLQFFTAVDHVFEYMVDSVLMNSRSLGNNLSHFAANAANKACGARTFFVCWIVRKDSQKIAIVKCGIHEVVFFSLAPIMLAQS